MACALRTGIIDFERSCCASAHGTVSESPRSLPVVLVAGLLVGIGTRLLATTPRAHERQDNVVPPIVRPGFFHLNVLACRRGLPGGCLDRPRHRAIRARPHAHRRTGVEASLR